MIICGAVDYPPTDSTTIAAKHDPPVRAYRTPFASRLTRNASAVTTKRPATVVTFGY